MVSVDRDGADPDQRPPGPSRPAAGADEGPGPDPSRRDRLSARRQDLLPYGEVLLVMDKIRTAGVTRIALVTVPLETAEGR